MNLRPTALARAALGAAVFLLGASAFAAPEAATANHAADMEKGLALFNSDVAKLLTEHCVKCHGGEKGTKGGFDLTTRETAVKEGDTGFGIVPGKSAESLVVKSIRHEDPDLKMPQKADKLPDDAIAKIARWVDLGAPFAKPLVAGKSTRDKSKVSDEDRKFWSFQPLAQPQPPAVKNEAWARTPLDRFILAKLEEKGIAPSPLAEKRKLIRRAYFDLIGLPPTPEQVERFVQDDAPNAFEKIVDELLANPHYGERWGRHWLDLARYAESHGYEQDYDRPFAFHYRDYVIRALNADQPYDEFLRWQIAGDELAPENAEAWKATGFLAAGTHATQITANSAEKERYDELDDMAGTIGTAMLGLTVGCARCHDHKFDPIPVADYYRFISTFTTTVRSDHSVEINARETQEKRAVWQREHQPIVESLKQWERTELPGRFAAWLAAEPKLPLPAWLTLEADKLAISGTYYGINGQKRQPDGSYLISVTAGTPDTYTFTVKTPLAGVTALRLDALGDASLPNHGPGWSQVGGFRLTSFKAGAKATKDAAPKDVKITEWRSSNAPEKAEKPDASWMVSKPDGRDLTAVFRLAEPLNVEAGGELTITMKFTTGMDRVNLGRFRLAVSSDAEPALTGDPFPLKDYLAAQSAASAGKAPALVADKPLPPLARLYCTTDPEWQKLNDAVAAHAKQEPRGEFQRALVSSEGLLAVRLHTQGPDFFEKTFFLKRGDVNQKQSEAVPGFLQIVSRADESRWQAAPPAEARTPMKRAALARWITDAESGAGHLAARVIVNRLWQHHLGRGIVTTPSDFGAQGEKPTHPELLDFLANELIRGGWRLKPLHKQIMLSAVYQQEVSSDPARVTLDPNNLLFSRRPRLRLESETIRDSILAVSGVLDAKMFGAGTLDPAMKRRSIYFQIKRSQLPPMMVTFDAPDTLQSMGQRGSTTVAPQALLLMNNEQIRGAAKTWAKQLAPLPAEQAVARAFSTALGRAPRNDELASVTEFLRTQTESYQATDKTDAAELARADFCQMTFGLNEFLYVE